MYELTDVHKYFSRGGETIRALDGVDLTIADGEFLAIQGPTGQGKSTLLLLLGGLDRPTEGQVVFEGRDLGRLGERELAELRAAAFGFVFQTFNLIPTLTAQENVETALVPFHVPSEERRRRARRALGDIGLGDRLAHLPSELSGGQQQRVAIARALIKEPTVLLADEPTGNLDEDSADEIVETLERLWREARIHPRRRDARSCGRPARRADRSHPRWPRSGGRQQVASVSANMRGLDGFRAAVAEAAAKVGFCLRAGVTASTTVVAIQAMVTERTTGAHQRTARERSEGGTGGVRDRAPTPRDRCRRLPSLSFRPTEIAEQPEKKSVISATDAQRS